MGQASKLPTKFRFAISRSNNEEAFLGALGKAIECRTSDTPPPGYGAWNQKGIYFSTTPDAVDGKTLFYALIQFECVPTDQI